MKIDFARADYGPEEHAAVNRVLASDWLASGAENESFEEEFCEFTRTDYAVCVNSGSSANLIALASLGLPKGSRVLTSACGFPATLSPILHLGLEPVLVDYDLQTHNVDVEQVLKNLHTVKAVIIAHTMGSPVEIDTICRYAKTLGVYVIEDCCEAVGSYLHGQPLGTFGDIGTFSFYPSHQMTAGGMGGMTITNNKTLMTEMKSMRDWGKLWNWDEKLGDNKTFYDQAINGLDYKYYRHYTYQTIGYNFKLAEMNAAFGREQLKKIDNFQVRRNSNHQYLEEAFKDITCFIPTKFQPDSWISWFGYVFTVRDGCTINRNEFGEYLESHGIRHRPFFAGNILYHPPFRAVESDMARLRFPVANKLMKDSLFIGCHTKMTRDDLDYIIKTVRAYVSLNCNTQLERQSLSAA